MYQQELKMIGLYAAASVVAVVLAGFVYTAVVPDQPAKPKAVEAGKPSNGLQLSLAAVREATTTFKSDNPSVVPIELVLTLTNVSDKPIKLDTYDMNWPLDVIGPDGNKQPTGKVLADVLRREPRPEDFPTIEPGKRWQKTFTFPGTFFHRTGEGSLFTANQRGEYRLKASYLRPQASRQPLAAGSWLGELHSNDLVVTVK